MTKTDGLALDKLQAVEVDDWTTRKRGVTEDALALSFCAADPNLRYVATWNRWMAWNERSWREDDTLAVFDRIRQHVRTTAVEPEVHRANFVAAVERMAKSDRRYASTVDQWDQDDWSLNTPGGIVDLRTGELGKSRPEAYMTKVTGFAPGGECPTWHRFLGEVTGDDPEYVAFLQRVAGYAASGSTREHALFFMYGPGGNGKGMFLNTLHKVLGDYATVADMNTFTETHSDRHPTDLAMLRGARLVLAQETEEGRAWAESRIKALTGGDPITARYMRQDFFTFTPKFKLLIAGNHKPRLRNVDEAMRRRLHLLPFAITFSGAKRDLDLGDKLIAEGPGILRWIIDGVLGYRERGLDPPQVVIYATDEYFAAQDLFDQWLADCCELGREFWDPPARLFASWKKYADNANEPVGTQKGLGERLSKAGFSNGNNSAKGGRFWAGLKVKAGNNETPLQLRDRNG